MTFEHRHENKSCLARSKDQHKHLTCDMRHVTLLQKFTVELTLVCPKDQQTQTQDTDTDKV